MAGLVLIACTPMESPADPFAPTPTIQAEAVSPEDFGEPVPVVGVLPDGTRFSVRLPGFDPRPLRAVYASIGVETENGTAYLWGIAEREAADDRDPRWEDRLLYALPVGEWVVRFTLRPAVVDVLGPDYRRILGNGLRVGLSEGMPVLALAPPLHWAGEEESGRPTQVLFDEMVVRAGCGELALACSDDRSVQVIPIPSTSKPLLPWTEGPVTVEAQGPVPEWLHRLIDQGNRPR